MRLPLATLLALASCGASWAPSNLDAIKAEVWASTSSAEPVYDYLDIHFVSRDELVQRCGEGRGECYDPGTLSLWVWSYMPNCGPVLAHGLRHYILHVTMGRPDEGHTLKREWEDPSLDTYRCEY
jgi:hypothetical protein